MKFILGILFANIIFSVGYGQVYDRLNSADTLIANNLIRNGTKLGYPDYGFAPTPYLKTNDGRGYQGGEEEIFIQSFFKKAYNENIQIPAGTRCQFSFFMNENGKIDKLLLFIEAFRYNRIKMDELKTIASGLLIGFQTKNKPQRSYRFSLSFNMPKYSIQ